jgi:hypothetical protein
VSAGCRRITPSLHQAQGRPCISGRRRHAAAILVLSTRPYRLTLRGARRNPIWPLHACRSSRMRQLDVIAVDRLADPSPRTLRTLLPGLPLPSRDSVADACTDRQTLQDAQSIFPLLKSCSLWPRARPCAAAEQRPYFRGRVPTLWFGRSRQRLDIHALGIICVPCGADCADDPSHKTSRSPDKGAVERHPGTLPVLAIDLPRHTVAHISHPFRSSRATRVPSGGRSKRILTLSVRLINDMAPPTAELIS